VAEGPVVNTRGWLSRKRVYRNENPKHYSKKNLVATFQPCISKQHYSVQTILQKEVHKTPCSVDWLFAGQPDQQLCQKQLIKKQLKLNDPFA